MKKTLLLTVLLFTVVYLFGQTRKIDSLKQLIHSSKNDEYRLKTILILLNEYQSLPKDTLWDYAIKAKSISTKLNDTNSRALAIVAQAHAYIRWNNIDSARALVEPLLLKYKTDDAAARQVYYKLEDIKIDCIGSDYFYKDALAEVYKVMREAEKYKDSVEIAQSMNTLSAWDYDMDFLVEARKWSYKALSYTSANPKYDQVKAEICINLGDNYKWIGKLDSAGYYINKGIALAKRVQNLFYLSTGFQRLSMIYTAKKEFSIAEQTIRESLQMMTKVEGDEPQQDKLMVLAAVYRHSGQIDKAIRVLQDGLAADSGYKSSSPHSKKGDNSRDLQKVFYYDELANCYKVKGDSKNYEAILEKIIAGKDAFYKANSASAIAELETKYEVQKKEATIAQQKLALAKENYIFYGSIVVVFLGGIIVWLVFNNLRRRQKLRLQKLREDEKLLAVKAVADAEETERRRIAADLHDNLGAQLSFIKRNVNFIIDQPEGFSPEDEKKYLRYVNDIAQNAMIDLRETIWVLNKDEVGVQEFADKLKSYLRQQLLDRQMITWDFQEKVSLNWVLSSGEVMHIFRIVQELVSNIIKHSGANHIDIKFGTEGPGTYRLEICDNGRGFDTNTKYNGHYGLENIQKRAADIGAALSIDSNPVSGTKVMLVKGKYNAYVLYNNASDTSNFTK